MSTNAPNTPAPSHLRLRRSTSGIAADRAYFAATAVACAVGVAAIAYFIWALVAQTTDVWSTFGVWGFLTGTEWVPTPASGPPKFGALPFIYGTLVTSIIAVTIALPLAIGVGLATTTFLPRRLRRPVAAVVDLLAAVPSVVFALWGFTVLFPFAKPVLVWIAAHSIGIGLFSGPVLSAQSFLVAGVVLAVMILPVIAAVAREVIATVPVEQREAAFGLGATRWEMVRGAVLPWSRSGLVGASALGLGRAVGETIAIAFLLGNDPGNLFGSILKPGSTLAATIALQVNESSGLQRSALAALGVVLFLLAFVVNALARGVVSRTGGPGRGRRSAIRRIMDGRVAPSQASSEPPALREETNVVDDRGIEPLSSSRRVRSGIAEWVIYGFTLLAVIPLALVLGYLLKEGAGALSWGFLTKLPPSNVFDAGGGIGNAIVGTVIMVGLATAIAAPLGILVALFISETASAPRPIRRLANGVGFFVDVLLGFPSILAGMVVYLTIVIATGGNSALAGALALALLMFPIVVRSSDEILKLVPRGLTEASLALGAPRWRNAFSVVLPTAAPGLVTGVMLAVARAAGETAPLLFTAGFSQFYEWDTTKPMAALPTRIFTDLQTNSPGSIERAWGAALVLIAMIFLLSTVARFVGRRSRKPAR